MTGGLNPFTCLVSFVLSGEHADLSLVQDQPVHFAAATHAAGCVAVFRRRTVHDASPESPPVMPQEPFTHLPVREDRFGYCLPVVQVEIMRGRVRQPLRTVKPPLFLLGAAADCDLVLGDLRFPQVHSYLLVNSNGVSFRHLGSDPGVTVGGRRVESVQLLDGDTIKTGPFEFRLRICDVQTNRRSDDRIAAQSDNQSDNQPGGPRRFANLVMHDQAATWMNDAAR